MLVHTSYETHNGNLLANIKVFKSWKHNLEGYKYEVFMLIDYNNFEYFINTKKLSSRQVYWA